MADAEIERFARQSLNGHLPSLNILLAGSFSNLSLVDYLEHRSDIDIFSWYTDINISPEDSPIPGQFTGKFYRLETCNSPDGYAKIIAYENNEKWTYYGKRSHVADPNHGPAYTIDRRGDDLISDLVTGLRCPVWPSKGTEWKERPRHSGWPSIEAISKIVNNGCHLVLKPHPSPPGDENEWRFSFVLAESTLLHTWDVVQRYIYTTLRLIKSNIVKEAGGNDKTVILKTYYFKTLLFWACEEKPSSFWEEGNIETAVKELLCQMIEWLIEKRCPNYFIPSCNLFDCLSIDPQREIELLTSYAEDPKLDPSQLLRYKGSFHFRFPRKVLLSSQMLLNCLNFVNPLQPEEVLSSLKRLAQSPLLTEELQSLYEAISIQRDIYLGGEDTVVQQAQRFFALANAKDIEREYYPITTRQSDYIYDLITNVGFTKFHSADNSDECLASESVPSFLSNFLEIVEKINDQLERPSYFLRAAYRANFYYTVLHDYQAAKQLCSIMLDLSQSLKSNTKIPQLSTEWSEFCLDRFSVVITDKWIRLFDAAIVATIGFLFLCDKVKTTIGTFDATPKTVIDQHELECFIGPNEKLFIRINPVDFFRYIKLQSLRLPYEQQKGFRIHSNDFLTACLKWSGKRDECTTTSS